MLILFFLYLGYIALAAAERERGGEGRMAALFGLVGAINLPIIHYSVLWWRTLHQGQSICIAGGSTIAPELLWPLPLTMIGFTALFAAVALMRMRADLARDQARSAAAPERGRMNQWPFVIAAYALTVLGDRWRCSSSLARDAPRRGRRRRRRAR